MWTRSYSVTSKEVTKEQMWKLVADVNNWHTWDEGIEYARMEGAFEQGNHFKLLPKGGPEVKIKLVRTEPLHRFTDQTSFPLATMLGDHVFEETAEGLKITVTMTVTGVLSFLWIKLVAQKIVDGLPKDVMAQVKAASKL
ncbi:MAG: polyketide cyclase [Azospira oryzae]|nr:MAG: polyketide cyclase [Azospira oryzae]